MGNLNTTRVEHLLSALPNTFRETEVSQILNDLDEEASGKGYSEVIRPPGSPFTSQIILWDSPSKIKKRTDTAFTRTGPFVSSIVKDIYNEEGTSIVSTVTASITRTGNNFVAFVDVIQVRI